MRVLAAAVLAATLVSGGAASAQVVGQKAYTTTAYSVEPFTPTTPIMIQGSGVRLRAEPFTGAQTPVLSSGSTGLVLNVVGITRQSNWDWYQVVLKSGQRAFIRSDLTSAPLRGGASPAQVAMSVSTPAASVAAVPALPAPTPLTSLGPPQPIDPPAVQLQTPVPTMPPTSPPTSNRGSLDLPKPSDPPGLLSH